MILLNALASLERAVWAAYGWPEETDDETIPALTIFVAVTILLPRPLASRMDHAFICRGDPVFRA